jgi:hypothetical protein
MKRPAIVLLVVIGAAAGSLSGQDRVATSRQFYTTWYKPADPNKQYFFRLYYYKPSDQDRAYRSQMVIYKPQRTKEWLYWYDPDKREFWARCATKFNQALQGRAASCKELWSVLPEGKRKAHINEVREEEFDAVQSLAPFIPGSRDQKRMDCPPTDLPES